MVCGKSGSRTNVFHSQMRMVLKNLLFAHSGGDWPQYQLHGNARSFDDRFTEHDLRIDRDSFVNHVLFSRRRGKQV